jgi:hypothetical protein
MDSPDIEDGYKYHFRPGYNSDEYLIEFRSGAEDTLFIPNFLKAIAAINPVLIDAADLWMNDEVILKFRSDIGAFTLSKDIWDLIFIMTGEDDNIIIEKINELLLVDKKFINVWIDPEIYK